MLLGKNTIGTIAYMGGVVALAEPFVWSWTQMIQYNDEHLVEPNERINYDRATVSYHSFARNTLVDKMQGKWLLMMDTDHQFEPDIAARMLAKMDKHNIDVLVGVYQYKAEPYVPVLYGYNPKNKKRYIIGDWKKNVDVIQIHSAGAGCLMVRGTVFERIKKELKENPFDIRDAYSEDHSFFERCHELGIKAFFSPNIESHHLIFKALSLDEDYDRASVSVRREGSVVGFN